MKKSNQFATSFPARPLVAPVTLAILSAISTLSVAETVQSVETVVVTATRVNQPLSEAASSITVVSEKEIAQTQPLTFAEILDTIPNVDTTSSTSVMYPENRGIYTQSDSSKKSSRNIWSLAVVSVDQRY